MCTGGDSKRKSGRVGERKLTLVHPFTSSPLPLKSFAHPLIHLTLQGRLENSCCGDFWASKSCLLGGEVNNVWRRVEDKDKRCWAYATLR